MMAVFLAVMATLVPVALFYWLIRHVTVTYASMIGYVVPLIAVIIGVIARQDEAVLERTDDESFFAQVPRSPGGDLQVRNLPGQLAWSDQNQGPLRLRRVGHDGKLYPADLLEILLQFQGGEPGVLARCVRSYDRRGGRLVISAVSFAQRAPLRRTTPKTGILRGRYAVSWRGSRTSTHPTHSWQ